MPDITQILSRYELGDPHAASELLPIVYDQLRRLAADKLGRENPGQTLQPMALVHEAYLRLVDVDKDREWNGRTHFLPRRPKRCAASWSIALGRSKARSAAVRGHASNSARTRWQPPRTLTKSSRCTKPSRGSLRPTRRRPQLVKLRYFAGLSIDETATALRIPSRSVDRVWSYARAWLQRATTGTLTNIDIPDSLFERVQQLALEQQVTIGQFITAAIAEKAATIDKEGYITARAGRHDAVKFADALLHIPNTQPEAYDKL
jgi:RNA polymerase sigma factor (TIGR02999 family)